LFPYFISPHNLLLVQYNAASANKRVMKLSLWKSSGCSQNHFALAAWTSWTSSSHVEQLSLTHFLKAPNYQKPNLVCREDVTGTTFKS